MFVFKINTNFSLGDGFLVSIFSISVVFVVLLMLQFLISLFSRIVNGKSNQIVNKEAVAVATSAISEDDSEERLIAKIISGCLAQEGSGQNIVIRSIKRVK